MYLHTDTMHHNADYAWSGFRNRSRRKEHPAGASSAAATACCHQHPVVHQGKQTMYISHLVRDLNVVLSFRCAITFKQDMEDMHRTVASCALYIHTVFRTPLYTKQKTHMYIHT